tara:strand:+ start:91 stop:534 length:444 start_codon:yes stop_codon:yes gene_type:complete
MTSIFLIRVSNKPGASRTVYRDFIKMCDEMRIYGSGLWDKDKKNLISVGDYLGFITGDDYVDHEVEFFVVDAELPLPERKINSWNTEAYSTTATADVDHRIPIRLVPSNIQKQNWSELYKKCGGEKDKYTPRGVTRSNKIKINHIQD